MTYISNPGLYTITGKDRVEYNSYEYVEYICKTCFKVITLHYSLYQYPRIVLCSFSCASITQPGFMVPIKQRDLANAHK